MTGEVGPPPDRRFVSLVAAATVLGLLRRPALWAPAFAVARVTPDLLFLEILTTFGNVA